MGKPCNTWIFSNSYLNFPINFIGESGNIYMHFPCRIWFHISWQFLRVCKATSNPCHIYMHITGSLLRHRVSQYFSCGNLTSFCRASVTIFKASLIWFYSLLRLILSTLLNYILQKIVHPIMNRSTVILDSCKYLHMHREAKYSNFMYVRIGRLHNHLLDNFNKKNVHTLWA